MLVTAVTIAAAHHVQVEVNHLEVIQSARLNAELKEQLERRLEDNLQSFNSLKDVNASLSMENVALKGDMLAQADVQRSLALEVVAMAPTSSPQVLF